MTKTFTSALMMALIATMLGLAPASAKSSSGTSHAKPSAPSRSSQPSYSKPVAPSGATSTGSGSAYSKPSAADAQKATPSPTPGPAATPGAASGAYSKPTAPAAAPAAAGAAAGAAAVPANAMDSALARKDSQAAYQKLQSQRGAFRQGDNAPRVQPAAGSTFAGVQRQSPQTIIIERNNYYGGWAAPSYAYFGYPHYGIWNTVFLFWMLEHISNPGYSSWYYHHYNDPGMDQFRAQLSQQSADNAQLRAQVASMQAQVNQLQAQGVARDPNYLPPGTKPEVAMADHLVTDAPTAESAVPQTANPPVVKPVAQATPKAESSGGSAWSYILALVLGGGAIGGIYWAFFRKPAAPTTW